MIDSSSDDARESIAFPQTVARSINYGFTHELEAAARHLEAAAWRDALFAAHRAWNHYGDWVLFLLGVSKHERRELRRQSIGLHRDKARKHYLRATSDRSLAGDSARWGRLTASIALRHEAEHQGKPIGEAQAREALAVRLELMRHIDGVLRGTHGVDIALLDRAPLPDR